MPTAFEDNQATAKIIISGRAPKLRHVQRMHNVSVSWLTDALDKGVFTIADCHTKRMAADVLTKSFVSKALWEHAIGLIGIVHDQKLLTKITAVDAQE